MNGDSFYLHNPQEVVYNRVKDLFDPRSASRQSNNGAPPLSALTGEIFFKYISIKIKFIGN